MIEWSPPQTNIVWPENCFVWIFSIDRLLSNLFVSACNFGNGGNPISYFRLLKGNLPKCTMLTHSDQFEFDCILKFDWIAWVGSGMFRRQFFCFDEIPNSVKLKWYFPSVSDGHLLGARGSAVVLSSVSYILHRPWSNLRKVPLYCLHSIHLFHWNSIPLCAFPFFLSIPTADPIQTSNNNKNIQNAMAYRIAAKLGHWTSLTSRRCWAIRLHIANRRRKHRTQPFHVYVWECN